MNGREQEPQVRRTRKKCSNLYNIHEELMTHKKPRKIKVTKVTPVEDKHLIELEVEGAPPLPTEPLPVEHIFIHEDTKPEIPVVVYKTWKEWFADLAKSFKEM